MTVVGSAEVRVRAIGDKLKSDIQRAFDKAQPAVSKSGDEAGKTFADRVAKHVEKRAKTTFKPVVDEAEEAGDDSGKNFVGSFGKVFEDKSAGLFAPVRDRARAAGRAAGEAFAAEAEAAGVGRDAKNAAIRAQIDADLLVRRKLIERQAEVDYLNTNRRVKGVLKNIKTVTGSIVRIGLKLSVLVPIIGVIIGGLSNIVTGLFAMSSAIAQAVPGALAVMPGLLLTIISTLAVTKLAFKGVGEALKNGFDPEKAEEYQKALAKLPKSAQGFVKQIVSMKDQFKALRTSAADGVFPNLTKAVELLSNKLDKKLNKVLKQTGQAIGDVSLRIAKDLTSTAAIDNLGLAADSNAKVIRSLGRVLGDLAASFLAIAAAAAPVTERFAKWLETMAEAKRVSLEAGAANGALTDKFEKSANKAAQIGRIIGNIVEGLGDIGKVAAPYGDILLDTFEKATKGLSDYTNETKNVSRLDDFFEQSNKNFLAISSLLKELGAAFLRLGENPGIEKAAKAIEGIVPSLEAALEAGTNNIPALVGILGKLADIFTSFASSSAVKAAINLIDAFVISIKALIETPVIGTILKYVAVFGLLAAKLRVFKLLGTEGLITNAIFGAKGGKGVQGSLASAAGGLTLFSSAADKADASTKRLSRSQLALRAGPGLLAVGALASGAADKLNLTNTASLTAAGALAGPWGAAAGAVAGFTLDIIGRNKRIKEEAKALDNVTKKIASSGTFSEQTKAAADLQKKLDKLQEGTKVTVSGGRGGGGGSYISYDEKKIAATKLQLERIKKAVESGTTDIELKIQFEQSSDDFDAFVKQAQKDIKGGLSLNIGDQIGRDTRLAISNLADTANTAGGPAIDAFRTKVINLHKDLGITAGQAGILANQALGVKNVFEGIPNAKQLKLSIKDDATKAGQGIINFLSKIGPFKIPVGANTQPARDDMAHFRNSKLFNPISTVVDVIRRVTEEKVKRARGGIVRGPGTGTSDSISAALSNGEFVINARQTAKNMSLLNAINNGADLDRVLPQRTKVVSSSSGSSGGGGSRGVTRMIGSLDLTDRSRVVLDTFAEDVYDSNASYDDTVRGMG